MLAMSTVFVTAFIGLLAVAEDTSVSGAYLAFTYGVLIWGWHELSYYMGYVTGPRKALCPPGSSNWQRFSLAIQTSLYHELAIITTAIALYIATVDTANQIGFWTFSVLWLMRWSAKLNIFFGIPNLHMEWLPDHLQFLQSYIVTKPMNLFFPIAITLATVCLVLLGQTIVQASSRLPIAEITGLTLVAALLALAILEHWFLVLPMRDGALWEWVQRLKFVQKSKSKNRLYRC